LNSLWIHQQQSHRHQFNAPQWQKRFDQLWIQSYHSRLERLKNVTYNLASIDPKNLLKKGYTILFDEKDNSVITSVHALKVEQKIRMLLADGEAGATITKVVRRD
jgi:exodeoxyribonuclease VII large subunit